MTDMPEVETDTLKILRLENDQRYIRQTLTDLHTELKDFIEHVRNRSRDEHFSKKDVVQLVGGAIGVSGILFAGFVYLVDSRVSPVKQDQAAAVIQLNNRLDTFQDSIRSLREIASSQQANISQTNVELSKDRKTLDTLEKLDLGALNARQDAEIANNRTDIRSLKDRAAMEDERVRDRLDRLTGAK